MSIRTFGLFTITCLTLATPGRAQSLDRGRQLFVEQKIIEAKAEFLALQKMGDQAAATSYYLGRIAIIENDGDAAVRHLERAVELEEANALSHAWLGNAIRLVTPRASKFKMALLARRMKKEWERAVQLDPNQLDARVGLIQFYAYAPGFWGGDKDKARAQVAEIAKRNIFRGALARGLMAEIEKNVAEEETAYKLAVASAPDSADGYFALSAMYARHGLHEQAFDALQKYERLHSNDPRLWYEVGRVAGTTGQQLERGEAALNRFLASPPPGASIAYIAGAHHWLGTIAEKRGNKGTARERYRTALKINPHSKLAKEALGRLK